MKSIVQYIFLLVVLYLYVHNPLFSFVGGMGSIKFLYLLVIVVILLFNYDYRKVYKSFKKETGVFFLLFLYTIFRSAFGGEPDFIYTHFIFFIEITFVPFVLVVLFDRFGLSEERKFVRFILVLGTIAGLISTVCLLVPSVNNYIKYSLTVLLNSDQDFWDFRGFGLSDSLTGFYGFTQGAILALGLICVKNNKWFLFFIPIFLVSILFNAIFAVVLIVYLLYSRSIRLSIYIGIGAIVVLLAYNYLINTGTISDESIQFVSQIFEEGTEAYQTRSVTGSNTMTWLFERMVIFPDTFDEWIFGRGFSLFGRAGMQSDIGYVLHLNYGGLLYSFILLYLLILVFKRMRHYKLPAYFIILFLCVYLIANFKSNYLNNTGTFRFMMFFYYVLVYNHIKNNKLTNVSI